MNAEQAAALEEVKTRWPATYERLHGHFDFSDEHIAVSELERQRRRSDFIEKASASGFTKDQAEFFLSSVIA